jgi:hypothetical protein
MVTGGITQCPSTAPPWEAALAALCVCSATAGELRGRCVCVYDVYVCVCVAGVCVVCLCLSVCIICFAFVTPES